MNIIFTICSNNYLAQATVLGRSVKKHEPDAKFIVFLCDEMITEIEYSSIADEIVPALEIEPRLPELAKKYTIVELNTCIKPRVFEYLFNDRGIEKALYLDPDIKLYSPLSPLFNELLTLSILLTPHICTPVPLDGKTPAETMFQNFGIYNLGFIGISNRQESLRFLSWWKERTYANGFVDVYNGIFVDQLPVNHVPVFFGGVKILTNPGYNMAPWNLHERWLSIKEGAYVVNEKVDLAFYHFSSFKIDSNELPLWYYDRFKLSARPDLQQLYREYNDELKAARYAYYSQFAPKYSLIKKEKKSFLKKIFGGGHK